jgi:hypothetical protein
MRHVIGATDKREPKGECSVEAVGTAHLTNDILAQRAVGASVSRRQITNVLHEPDGAPELVLDLVTAEGGEHATISMTWSRDDLERLLEAASGDEVALMFDRDELASAFSDVEAHGLRARTAVFAVAAAGALGSGAIANATVVADGGGAAATPITATSTADASAALRARSEALNQEYGLGTAGDAAAAEATRARSEALNQEYGLGTAGDAVAAEATRTRSEALNQEYGLGTAGDAAATEATRARSEALNQEYGLGGPATESSGGLTLERASADDALLIGGLLLTIAGATFAVRRTAGGRLA